MTKSISVIRRHLKTSDVVELDIPSVEELNEKLVHLAKGRDSKGFWLERFSLDPEKCNKKILINFLAPKNYLSHHKLGDILGVNFSKISGLEILLACYDNNKIRESVFNFLEKDYFFLLGLGVEYTFRMNNYYPGLLYRHIALPCVTLEMVERPLTWTDCCVFPYVSSD